MEARNWPDRNKDRNVEGNMVEKLPARKRKLRDDWTLQNPSQKRCRSPLPVSRSEREKARDKITTKIFNFNTLLNSFEPGPAGEARSEHPGGPSQGVGEDAVFLENSDSPETHARTGTVRQYSRYTASLGSDQKI